MNDLQRYMEIWAGYARDEIEGLLPHTQADVVWEEYRLAPGAQVWHGHDGLRAQYRRWQEDFEGFGFEPAGTPEQLAPGVIAMRVNVKGRGRASGIQIDWRIVLVVELRDGLIANAFYTDTMEEARERLAR